MGTVIVRHNHCFRQHPQAGSLEGMGPRMPTLMSLKLLAKPDAVTLRTWKGAVTFKLATFSRLEADLLRLDVLQRRALVKSFCVHARNLNDFFSSKKNNRPTDSEAIDFATADYKPPEYGPIHVHLYEKINWQISHLTKNRT